RLKELPGEAALFSRSPAPGLLLHEADKLTAKLNDETAAAGWMALGFLMLSAVTFLVCVTSALAFHGGLRYRMLGVCVVRGTGRPAGRLRCAWRVLLAW